MNWTGASLIQQWLEAYLQILCKKLQIVIFPLYQNVKQDTRVMILDPIHNIVLLRNNSLCNEIFNLINSCLWWIWLSYQDPTGIVLFGHFLENLEGKHMLQKTSNPLNDFKYTWGKMLFVTTGTHSHGSRKINTFPRLPHLHNIILRYKKPKWQPILCFLTVTCRDYT